MFTMKKDVNRLYIEKSLGKKKEKELFTLYNKSCGDYKTYYSYLFELHTYYYNDFYSYVLMLPKSFNANDIEILHKCLDFIFICSSGL